MREDFGRSPTSPNFQVESQPVNVKILSDHDNSTPNSHDNGPSLADSSARPGAIYDVGSPCPTSFHITVEATVDLP
nr:hypothetical protein CFP56_72815 [Quercus suber]